MLSYPEYIQYHAAIEALVAERNELVERIKEIDSLLSKFSEQSGIRVKFAESPRREDLI